MISACCSFNNYTRHPLSTDSGSTVRSESRAWLWWIPTEKCRICISRWWIPNYRWQIWNLRWGSWDPAGSPNLTPASQRHDVTHVKERLQIRWTRLALYMRLLLLGTVSLCYQISCCPESRWYVNSSCSCYNFSPIDDFWLRQLYN